MSHTRIDAQLRRASARATKVISSRPSSRSDMWQGCGYPKSGTTLLCHLMSSYLDLPYPRNYRLPVAMPCILQSHWLPYRNMPKTIYVVRDGRDVLLSRYFYEVHWAGAEDRPRAPWRRKRLARILGVSADLSDVRTNLPRFIEAELTSPSLARTTWPAHVNAWLDQQRHHVSIVRYEDLIIDVASALGPSFEHLTGLATDLESLNLAAARFEFKRMSQQKARGVDGGPYMRKGVSGDWKNHFTKEASQVFEQIAGPTLVRAGYQLGASHQPTTTEGRAGSDH